MGQEVSWNFHWGTPNISNYRGFFSFRYLEFMSFSGTSLRQISSSLSNTKFEFPSRCQIIYSFSTCFHRKGVSSFNKIKNGVCVSVHDSPCGLVVFLKRKEERNISAPSPRTEF